MSASPFQSVPTGEEAMGDDKTLLRAVVDEDRCAGVAQCMIEAPEAFSFNDAGFSTFDPQGEWSSESVRRAADSCPMAAIRLVASGS
jgi:ferredoxin